MGHKISVPAFMSPVTIGQCGDTGTGAWEHWPLGTPGHPTRPELRPLELETKVHPKVRNHGKGPY